MGAVPRASTRKPRFLTVTKRYDPERIGPTLVRLRKAHGYSQMTLAQLLCLHSGHPTLTRHEISRWERQERMPSEFWLLSLAAVLTVPIDTLRQAIDLTRGPRTPRRTIPRPIRDLHAPVVRSWLILHHGPQEIMIALAGVQVDQLRTVLAPVGPPQPITEPAPTTHPVEATP
jgi:transcriptional regulator with XRE-family HTH domain